MHRHKGERPHEGHRASQSPSANAVQSAKLLFCLDIAARKTNVLVDSANRLKPQIFHWRSLTAVAHIPSFTCAVQNIWPAVRRLQPRRQPRRPVAAKRMPRKTTSAVPKTQVARTATQGQPPTGQPLTGLQRHRPKPKRRRRGVSSRMCGVCERIFSSRSAVRRHLVTHTGHKPFSCTVCGRHFSLKGNLMAHNLTHSGAKPFECRLCPQVFSQRCSLNRPPSKNAQARGKVISSKGRTFVVARAAGD
ncbi:hypothetical protein MTO96_004941 [Rhipicephalus appendiculatus]